MNPVDEEDVSAEEREDAALLAAYVAGDGAPPTVADGEVVGLLREARGEAPPRRQDWRAYRPRDRRLVPGLMLAAAVLLAFLWPRLHAPPPGPSAEDYAKAVELMASPAPVGKRMAALHRLAARAREPVVDRLLNSADGPELPSTVASAR